MEFKTFAKIPRLSRECIITEKIDGANGVIWMPDFPESYTFKSGREVPFLVGSRNRWILPENDNYGFAKWAYEHSDELLELGPGYHYGEWWGKGIQRGYGLQEKRFSLFNTHRWNDPELRPKCCGVVPILWKGMFETLDIAIILNKLYLDGSKAAPGFMKPEGIVIFHTQSGYLFKKTIENDEKGKENE